jgi:hypothetical protein
MECFPEASEPHHLYPLFFLSFLLPVFSKDESERIKCGLNFPPYSSEHEIF